MYVIITLQRVIWNEVLANTLTGLFNRYTLLLLLFPLSLIYVFMVQIQQGATIVEIFFPYCTTESRNCSRLVSCTFIMWNLHSTILQIYWVKMWWLRRLTEYSELKLFSLWYDDNNLFPEVAFLLFCILLKYFL